MTDNLRDRIAAVLKRHVEDQLTNYDAGRNECGCGHQGDATYRQHLADAVIAELGLVDRNCICGKLDHAGHVCGPARTGACVCGHPKSEHDKRGMCSVDYLLCGCSGYCPNNLRGC